jgi:hypothetical protein
MVSSLNNPLQRAAVCRDHEAFLRFAQVIFAPKQQIIALFNVFFR